MTLVKEVMVPVEDYSTIHEEATIKEAVAALRSSFHKKGGAVYGHHSLIVLDDRGQLVGLLTLRSLLSAVSVRALVEDVWIKTESWSWYFLNQLQEQAQIKVKEIMRPIEVVTVKPEENVLQAAMLLYTYQVNSLPVLDRGKVVGILRTIDVFGFVGSGEVNELLTS
ncbi:MAG TPA: CBS domain-containing protein [Desulfotomaculum sp.]|nr:CBS domain-containing protein [Desulfofundulus thermobenzoicus]HHW42874.1 CBS domain-containing protein [Desulfotomaculum sp.]